MADLDQEIRRGQEAEQLMSHPMLRDALDKIEKAAGVALIKADLNDEKRLKTLVGYTQIIDSFRKILRETMETGKLARIQKETLAQSILRKVKG